jgi:hypothetical protein
MLSEDQYMERTPDLVGKIRAMREVAQKQMNRFTRLADYDVRHVVGQLPKNPQVSNETAVPSVSERRRKRPSAPATMQTTIDFSPAPGEHGDGGEAA